MKLTEQHNKIKEKNDVNKKKLKKYNELTTQSKRQAALLDQRTKEISHIKMEMNTLQTKLQDRERVHF